MPDFGAILRKAREGAVLGGAAGASGATPERTREINASAARSAGPTVKIRVGPVGPYDHPGPTGPSVSPPVGPALTPITIVEDQRLSEGGPSGPGGPIEKRHVCENAVPVSVDSSPLRDVLPDTPQGWRDGLARLDRWTPPCEGFRSGEWEAVHRAVSHFMGHYTDEAAAHGWTAIDLFGVHGLAGAARVDSCGALMLPLLRNVTALTADAITFGPLTYRRRAMPEAMLVWDLVGEAA